MTDRERNINVEEIRDILRQQKQQPSPLTLEMVERAVAQAREMLIDQHNDWTPRRREAGHAALDLFRLCLRQQMGGGGQGG